MAQSTDVAATEETKAPVLVQQDERPHNPFERSRDKSLAAGTVEIESSRAVAEAQAKLLIAQRFPRDPYSAWERALNACMRPGLAESSIYSYKRGGEDVSGPSIRLAEELARCWGNVDYGLRELSNRDGLSEMEAYAWDLETNTISTQRFTVRHIRDTKGGSRSLTQQRDIYEITANMGARRLRARILAILPDDLKDAAVAQCRRTIAGDGKEPIGDRIKKMVAAFGKLDVSSEQLEQYLGHPLKQIVPDELVTLQGVYTSLKDGLTTVGEVFGARQLAEPEPPKKATGKDAPKTKADKPKAESKTETKKADEKPKKAEPAPEAELTEPEHDPETGEIAEPDEGGTGDDAPAMAGPDAGSTDDSKDEDLF
ncbi:hypothetical protein HW532_15805 [Kaustia mangrovi]|uniref:Uncharacterized protein n=1 Tax=Kaustia mangrovi TaxID=2593653 RepID=A0A7S8C606_9HYPH|nr:hypothetical protein [Kaustia mangrovi]QPC44027.1 hypothetical protein HW532_15805 [Kaustia mangrovi]